MKLTFISKLKNREQKYVWLKKYAFAYDITFEFFYMEIYLQSLHEKNICKIKQLQKKCGEFMNIQNQEILKIHFRTGAPAQHVYVK